MITLLPSYLIAVDLGQVNDYTAIVVAERRVLPTGRQEVVTNVAAYFDGGKDQPRRLNIAQHAGHYDLTHIERLPLATPYTAVPARIETIVRTIVRELYRLHAQRLYEATGQGYAKHTSAADITLVVDRTGVGAAVVNLLWEHGLRPVAIMITGGDTVLRVSEDELRVPKRDLAGVIQALLQTRRLRWAKSLPAAQVLKAELETFKARISLSDHHDRHGAGDDWREGNHDDLVLAVALATWFGEFGQDAYPALMAG
jgi:hypothetical protein